MNLRDSKSSELIDRLIDPSENRGSTDLSPSEKSEIGDLEDEILRRLEEAKKPKLIFLCYGEKQVEKIESIRITTEVPPGFRVTGNFWGENGGGRSLANRWRCPNYAAKKKKGINRSL